MESETKREIIERRRALGVPEKDLKRGLEGVRRVTGRVTTAARPPKKSVSE